MSMDSPPPPIPNPESLLLADWRFIEDEAPGASDDDKRDDGADLAVRVDWYLDVVLAELLATGASLACSTAAC